MNRLVETSQLKTDYWKGAIKEQHSELRYNQRSDVLTVLITPQAEKIIVHYIDEHVSILYRHSDKQVVGFRIESFTKSFMPKYSELQQAWSLKDTGVVLNDFGDLKFEVMKRELPIVRKVSEIFYPMAIESGLELEPVC